MLALEIRIVKFHAEDGIRPSGHMNRIDSDKWRPMVMSFQELYNLAAGKMVPSKLAFIQRLIGCLKQRRQFAE